MLAYGRYPDQRGSVACLRAANMSDQQNLCPPAATDSPFATASRSSRAGPVASGSRSRSASHERAPHQCSPTSGSTPRGRRPDALTKVGHPAIGLGGDVSKASEAQALVGSALERFGRIDILVNNAGCMGRVAPLWELRDDDWNDVLAVDLTSVFLVSRAVIPQMRARGSGCIVSVSSIAGKEGTPGLIPYSVAKAGIIRVHQGARQRGRRGRHPRQLRGTGRRRDAAARSAAAGVDAADAQQGADGPLWNGRTRWPPWCISWHRTRRASSPRSASMRAAARATY